MAAHKLNSKSMTLLEILIAMILASLAFACLAATFTWCRRNNLVSQRRLQAVDFAKEGMEELLLIDKYDNTALSLEEHDLPLPDCDLKNKYSGSRSYDITAVTEGKQIAVKVGWTEEGEAKEEKLYGLAILNE